ncbi:ribonuclease HII [Brachyspira hampsonii]|uniref:Ribonuclease HII n=2 Tax=Brachyspira hampsonii TaxID=1287055 RepID=A0AAC9TS50_9SPIR|nr:ribonuclease HII [Brachyspira hampsonii]ASJ21040.1 ribonuclease HII [Brachyspira hampsonii]ELV05526.1 ribonuclease HII [Brachyspira hampsonii 30599]MBW5411224.1 ribonuclease HII [Brachyspira hampsonii]OEJ13232.1 ribonuclease HII [Brachyspira hampsonii]
MFFDDKADKFVYEREYLSLGHKYICGIDEVGRGCLFGPVTVAAVIMPLEFYNDTELKIENIVKEVDDSKKISAKKREELYDKIIDKALSFSIYSVDSKTIDEINIYNAVKLAMIKAVEKLSIKPDILLIDAMKLDTDIKQCSIIKGDSKSYSIGCASILAKVYRDRMMNDLPDFYQKYKVSKNKGYGTKEHMKAIEMYGPSDMHRYSFEPMKSNYKKTEDDLLL